jgi:hypothetical protein
MNRFDKILTTIASEHLGIATLETRNSDSLDFHDVSVWGVKYALSAAYQAGANDSPARLPGGGTAMDSGHSSEPWTESGMAIVQDAQGNIVADCDSPDLPPSRHLVNARRIVAAINASAGIGTCALENGVLREMLAALQWFEGAWRKWAEDLRGFPKLAANTEMLRIYDAARAAIANATAATAVDGHE